jgi:hypothetical protein
MASKILTYEEIIEQARQTWAGSEGDKRAEKVKVILDTRLENYSKVTGFTKDEILQAFEKRRGVNTVNFYQENNLPLLDKGKVHVFQTIKEFQTKFPSHKSICPSCGKESTDFYECSQPDCDWKVYGLLRDLGKGIRIIIKDKFLEHPVPELIFTPIELIQEVVK